jgi:hypothetical protein
VAAAGAREQVSSSRNEIASRSDGNTSVELVAPAVAIPNLGTGFLKLLTGAGGRSAA